MLAGACSLGPRASDGCVSACVWPAVRRRPTRVVVSTVVIGRALAAWKSSQLAAATAAASTVPVATSVRLRTCAL